MLLPGKPQSALQAVSTGEWQRKRIIAYISNSSLVILVGANKLLHTFYHDYVLTCVALDETTGKLAVAGDNYVLIYKPDVRRQGELNFTLQTRISLPTENGAIATISWGDSAELLVGSKALSLWSTTPGDIRRLWRRDLGNKTKLALFCPDASLAASIAEHDCLVKIWRRYSIGSEDVQFDFSYLPHPDAVFEMHWRQPTHPDETTDNVLYTISRDHVLRVWAPVYPHDIHLLQLWAVVDLREGPTAGLQSACVVDHRSFRLAAETAVARAGDGEKDRVTLQGLVEIAKRSPEIVIGFDSRGRMSAWGLENVGCKSRKTTNVFTIVQGEDCGIQALRDRECEVQFQAFVGSTGLVILAHLWDGRIYWLESRLDLMLDPSPRRNRLTVKGMWTGHWGTIKTMIRTADGKALITASVDNELHVWGVTKFARTGLEPRCLITSEHRVRRASILEGGKFVMTLHEDYVTLWDTRGKLAVELQRLSFHSKAKILCLLLLPERNTLGNVYHLAAVDIGMSGIAWEVTVPSAKENGGLQNGNGTSFVREFARFNLGTENEEILAMVPVEPVGWNAVLSENLDIFSREVATTVCASGLLKSWTAQVTDGEVKWLATSRVSTGITNPSYAKSSSIRKIAIVDESKKELTIWDSKAGILEHQSTFSNEDTIRDLDWTSTPQDQSVLAVGFPHRVLLMSQLRFDYLNAGPAWASFREINIEMMSPHPIGDSTWLQDGALVIGAGNQLFVYPREVDEIDTVLESLHLSHHKNKLNDLFSIVSELNGPLPVYHPQFLQQCMLAGKTDLAETILVKLYKELKTYHEEIGLDPLLNIPPESFYEREKHESKHRPLIRSASYFDSYDDLAELSLFDETLASDLCDFLKNIAIPHLTGPDQISLTGIVESAAQVEKHRRSIDENAAHYLLFFRQHTLRRENRLKDLSFREFSWAFHSNSQDILVDQVNRNCQNRMLWPQARESGVFIWLTDTDALKRQFETVARNLYTENDKDPVACSLFYLALKKKKVLTGLWRVATLHKEQTSTFRFLSNNFEEQRWKTAAMKNAYTLLGKHRFEYAAAFFLLADSLDDAMHVCYYHIQDMQLAIAIGRVYEGDDGPVLRDFLHSKVLPKAVATGDRWLATWAYWMLRRRDMAVRALLAPLDSLMISPPATPPLPASRLFLLDDPALTIFYKSIREKTLQTLQGAEKISPDMEFGVVLHTARLYDRMGCDLLALDLVRNWEFLPHEKDKDAHRPLIEAPTHKRLRRRSSVAPQDDVKGEQEFRMPANLVKPPVAIFEEPDMSMLDW